MAVLAAALRARGHRAVVVALRESEPVCRALGAEVLGIDGSIDVALRAARGRFGDLLNSNPAGQGWLLWQWTRGLARPVVEAWLDRVRPGDAVVTGILGRPPALALVEGCGARMATVVFTGQVPTLHPESHCFDDWFTRSRAWNRVGVDLNWAVANQLGAELGRAARTRLGLPGRSPRALVRAADRWPTLVAASPVLVPPADDWPSRVVQTGWLGAPVPRWQPDDALDAFVRGGVPCAWVGWGSFSGASRPEDVEVLARAAALSGVRVLTPRVPGVADGRLSDEVLAVGPVPHAALFGRLDAVVHHGGAGTTHEALRAGVPSMAVPFGVDQPWHARRLHALGVGPAPVGIHQLTADRLATRLDDLVSNDRYRARASRLGERVRNERGPDAAVDALTRARVVSG